MKIVTFQPFNSACRIRCLANLVILGILCLPWWPFLPVGAIPRATYGLKSDGIIPVDSWVYNTVENFQEIGLFQGAPFDVNNRFELKRAEAAILTTLALTNINAEIAKQSGSDRFSLNEMKELQRLLVEFSPEVKTLFSDSLDRITLGMIKLDRIVAREQARRTAVDRALAAVSAESTLTTSDRFAMEKALTEASFLAKSGNLQKARDKLAIVLRSDPANSGALMMAGNISASLGDRAMAREFYRRLLVRDENYVEARLARARLHMLDGSLDKAEIELKRALGTQPDLAEAHFELALVHAKAGDLVKTTMDYMRVLDGEPFNPTAHTGLGITFGLRGDRDRAVLHFRKALAAAPEKVFVKVEYARTLERIGDIEGAILQSAAALAQEPASLEALGIAARCLEALGRHAEAMEKRLLLLKDNPKHIPTIMAVGENYFKAGEFSKAAEMFGLVLNVDPSSLPARVRIADSLSRMSRHAEALGRYDSIIGKDPSFLRAWIGKGRALLWNERYEQGLDSFEQALRIKPDDLEAAFGLGLCQLGLGDWHKAIASFELCLRIEPDSSHVLVEAGNMYAYLGHFVKAKRYLLKAMEITPRYAVAGRIFARVEESDDPYDSFIFTHSTQKDRPSKTILANRFGGFLNDSLSYRSELQFGMIYSGGAEDRTQDVSVGMDYRLGHYTSVFLEKSFFRHRAGFTTQGTGAGVAYLRGRLDMTVGLRVAPADGDLYESLAVIPGKRASADISYRINKSFALTLSPVWETFDSPVNNWAAGLMSAESNRRQGYEMALKFKPLVLKNTTFLYKVKNASFSSELDSLGKPFYYFSPSDEKGTGIGIGYEWNENDDMEWGLNYLFDRDVFIHLGNRISSSTNSLSAYLTKSLGKSSAVRLLYDYEKTRNIPSLNLFNATLRIGF